MKPRIVLAVNDKKREETYLASLKPLAECVVLKTLKDIPSLTGQSPYHGILIDVSLNLKATHMEKSLLIDSLRAMPSAILNLSERSGSIKLLMKDEGFGTARSVEEFTILCVEFQPKIVCPHNRYVMHLNALLATSQDLGQDAERTFTMNVSEGGCFLFTANQAVYRPRENVWIDFVELTNRRPILGKICWKCEWGVSRAAPGIGIRFESILESQRKELQNFIKLVQTGFNWTTYF